VKKRRPLKPSKDAVWNERDGRWTFNYKLRQNKPFKKPDKRAKMSSISPARARDKKIYNEIKPHWHKTHPYCEALCKDRGIKTPSKPYPHHVRGRVGSLLYDVRFFLPTCDGCHAWIERNREAAKLRGWLASRDRKAMLQEGLV
jgi:hypothetical protein